MAVMEQVDRPELSFVIRADELQALNYLAKGHPRPARLRWINRGTNQEMRPTTVAMLLRTLFRPDGSPSIARLHRGAGLRVTFASEADREQFARSFAQARNARLLNERHALTAVFDNPPAAERAYADLIRNGANAQAISLLWRAGQFIAANHARPPGHSKLSVAVASTGAAVAGAVFGVTVLSIPGFGLLAAGGALASQALGTIGAVGGALGAAGGGIAAMLTDLDVDDREVPYFLMEITSGRVFVSVHTNRSGMNVDTIRAILVRNGGHSPR